MPIPENGSTSEIIEDEKREADSSIPENIQAVIRQVAGNSQPINFNGKFEEIYEFDKKKLNRTERDKILKKLKQGFTKECGGSSPPLHDGTRPAQVAMFYEKYP